MFCKRLPSSLLAGRVFCYNSSAGRILQSALFESAPFQLPSSASFTSSHSEVVNAACTSNLFSTSTKDAQKPSYCAGQPTPDTHPELLAPGETTVGILASEYADRRRRLLNLLPEDSLVLLPAGNTIYMSGIIPYPYRQEADFFYLSGILQPAVLALQKAGASPSGRDTFTVFVDPPSDERDRWDGRRVDREAARQFFGADEVYYTHEMPRWIGNTILAHRKRQQESQQPQPKQQQKPQPAKQTPAAAGIRPLPVFFDLDRQGAYRHNDIRNVLGYALPQAGGSGSIAAAPPDAVQIQSLRPLLHSLRFVKSPAEAAMMRRSAQVAARGIRRCIKICAGVEPEPKESVSQEAKETTGGDALLKTPSWQATEAALAATFEYVCKAEGGAQRLSYPSVVAAGTDALTIHYGRNDKRLRAGQLLLMDAGCEFHGFCSDVTRTWPIGGKFSEAQRAVYEVVLEAHQRCVAAARPGVTIRRLHALSVCAISEGARRLGLFPGLSATQIAHGPFRDIYWHSVGHHLGLDTHDSALMGYERTLEPGCVVTVEPGVYVPDDPKRFGPFAGVGVRIEDDVLITKDGCEVLSRDVPIQPDEIEELMRRYRDGHRDEDEPALP